MNDYKIIIDASCDMNNDFRKQYGIDVIPMPIYLNDKEYEVNADTRLQDEKEYYKMLKNGALSTTSQVAPAEYEKIFSDYVKRGISVLYLCLSSGLSSTYGSAVLSAEEVSGESGGASIKVFDTLSATCGIGTLVHMAVINKNKGMGIEENYEKLISIRDNINIIFMVDDLMYLKRGGRLSAGAAIIGSALKVKPILKINVDGKLEIIDKKRGVKVVAEKLVEIFKKKNGFENEFIYINHSGDGESLKLLKNKILETGYKGKIYEEYLTPIIGCHTGFGYMALCFVGDKK